MLEAQLGLLLVKTLQSSIASVVAFKVSCGAQCLIAVALDYGLCIKCRWHVLLEIPAAVAGSCQSYS